MTQQLNFLVCLWFLLLTIGMLMATPNITLTTLTHSYNINGEGALATSTYISGVNSVVSSHDGSELYFTKGSIIQKVNKNRTLETIAGTGQSDYNKDHNGGKAINAYLNYPNILLLDETNGDLYFNDRDNYLVRKVDTNGNIYDIAGLAGNSGIVDGNFSLATFGSITSMSFYGSNKDIVVSDVNCVRSISQFYSNVSTLYCGKESERFYAVVVTSLNEIYLSEVTSNNIVKLNNDMSNTTVIAGGGIVGVKDGDALSSLFDYPHSMALKESTQELFISSNRRIRKLNLQTKQVSTIVGGADLTYESFTRPNYGSNITIRNNGKLSYNSQTNSIYIVDDELFIRKVNISSEAYWTNIVAGSRIAYTVYGTTYDKTYISGYISTFNSKGEIFQTSSSSVLQFKDGMTSLFFDVPSLDYIYPDFMKFGKDSLFFSDRSYILNQYFLNGSFLRMDTDYKGVDNVPISKSIESLSYLDIHFEKNGDYYLLAGDRIRKVSGQTGIISTIHNLNAENQGTALAILDNGDIYYSDRSTIRKVESKETSTVIVGTTGSSNYDTTTVEALGTSLSFVNLKCLLFNPFDGLLYFCDTDVHLIRNYNFTSKMVTIAVKSTDSQFYNPSSMALHPSTGHIYFTDSKGFTIRKLADGIVTTIAGKLTIEGNIDGPLLEARFSSPYFISTTNGDEFLIMDMNGLKKMSLSKGTVETIVNIGRSGDGLVFSKENTRISVLDFIRQSPYNGDLYWNEYWTVRKVDNRTNIVSTVTYKLDNKPIHYSQTVYQAQSNMDINSKGELIFFDAMNYRIRKMDSSGMISLVAGSGDYSPNYSFKENMNALDMQFWSVGIAVCPTDDLVYFTETESQKIIRVNANGTVSLIGDGNGILQCTKFGSLIYISDGIIYKCSNNKTTVLFDESNIGRTFNSVYSFSVSPVDNSILVDENGYQISRIGCDQDGFEMQDDYKTCLRMCYGKGFNACSGRGQCLDFDNCSCPNGWIGLECESAVCYGLNRTDACSGPSHGSCSSPNNCSCLSGWSGSQCEIQVCYGLTGVSACGGLSNGQCSSPNNCSCSNGWSGQQCETPICYGLTGSNSCSGPSNGYCISPNNCTCSQGYYGSECSKFDCFGIEKSSVNVCSKSNGKCSSPNNCSCLSGFIGATCESVTCFGLNGTDACSGISHGSCASPNNCSCLSGWSGSQCQAPICFNLTGTSACGGSSNGQCSSPNNCTCLNGWSGQQCEIPICYGLTGVSACSGKGVCLSPNTCTCLIGFSGKECELTPTPSASQRIVNSSKHLNVPFILLLIIGLVAASFI